VNLHPSFEGNCLPPGREDEICLPLTAIAEVLASKAMPTGGTVGSRVQMLGGRGRRPEARVLVEAAPVAVLKTEAEPGNVLSAAAAGASVFGKSMAVPHHQPSSVPG